MTPQRSGRARSTSSSRTGASGRTGRAGRPGSRRGDGARSRDRTGPQSRARTGPRARARTRSDESERRPQPFIKPRRAITPAAIEAVLRRQPWDTLRRRLADVGAPSGALERLKTYTRLVLEWNRGVSNIVSRNDEPRFVERHLLESIAPARALRESGATRWLDFGSGAGLPAIPLAIAGIGASWTLVESRRTKTLFLRKAIQEIGLHEFEVIHDRLENVVSGHEGNLIRQLSPGKVDASTIPGTPRDRDGFTSRATMPLPPTLSLAAPLIRAGGNAFLWKGSGAEAEMSADPSWREAWDHARTIPVGSGPNIVAIFTRK